MSLVIDVHNTENALTVCFGKEQACLQADDLHVWNYRKHEVKGRKQQARSVITS